MKVHATRRGLNTVGIAAAVAAHDVIVVMEHCVENLPVMRLHKASKKSPSPNWSRGSDGLQKHPDSVRGVFMSGASLSVACLIGSDLNHAQMFGGFLIVNVCWRSQAVS